MMHGTRSRPRTSSRLPRARSQPVRFGGIDCPRPRSRTDVRPRLVALCRSHTLTCAMQTITIRLLCPQAPSRHRPRPAARLSCTRASTTTRAPSVVPSHAVPPTPSSPRSTWSSAASRSTRTSTSPTWRAGPRSTRLRAASVVSSGLPVRRICRVPLLTQSVVYLAAPVSARL